MTQPSAPATMTVTGRLVRTPGAIWAAVIAAIGLALAIMALREAPRLQRPDLGKARFDEEMRVVQQGAGLHYGDRVVAVGGVKANRMRLYFFVTEFPAEDTVAISVERGGQVVDVVAPMVPLRPLHLVSLWVRVVCGVLCFVLGVVSFILAPGSRSAWLYLVFCVAFELLLLFNVILVRHPDLQERIEPLSFALAATVGLHMFLEMPQRVALLVRFPRLLPVIVHLPTVVLGLLGILQPWLLILFLATAASMLGGLIAGPVLYLGMRRAPDEPTRSRYRTLLWGMLIGLFLPAAIHLLRTSSGEQQEKWAIHLNSLPVIVYVITAAWSLLRQNVLGADRVTTVVVSYFATLIFLAAGCGVVLVAVPLLVRGQIADSPLTLVATTAAASLSVVPLYRRLRAAVDRRFQRDRATDERMTRELRELMRVASLHGREEAFAVAERTLSLLAPESIGIWLLEVDTFRKGDDTLPATGPLGDALRRDPHAAGVNGLAMSLLPDAAQAELWQRQLALVAPLTVHGDLRGFVALGRRISGTRYAPAEEEFLAAVAAQLAVVLERAGEDTIGRYRLVKRLGVGGMAEVFLARQVGLAGFERKVAIKRPFANLMDDPAFVTMFLDEARLAAALHHPNIVQTHEVDRADGAYFIAMEYVEGLPLRTLLRACRHSDEHPPLPITVAIVDALLRALAYAHGKSDDKGEKLGIVHRDVSPGNLLIGVNGEVKLVDFGVARSAMRAQQTQAGVVKGTLAYMAPEQAQGRAVDARSDLFGAAAILVECLTGKPPFPDGPPRTPSGKPLELEGTIPEGLQTVIRRALAHDPAKRHPRAEDMRRALLDGAGVAPASAGELARWLKELAARDIPSEPLPLHEAETAVEKLGIKPET
jgi:hypothetical protein